MKIKINIVASTLLAALLLPGVQAADLLVPAQFPTVQAAIDAASAGDVVQISPGTYSGPIDLRGKPISVRGADATTTFVSGGDSVVRCVSGEGPSTIVEGLTITGGSNANIDGQGGGIHIVGSSPTIRFCRILGNTSTTGGGVHCKQGAPLISDCLVAANTSTSQYALGGGLYFSSSSASVTRCLITGNRLLVAVGNSCGGGAGAGIYATGSGSLRIESCTVISNQTSISASSACNFNEGAGIYISAPNTSVTDCVVRENANSGVGGNVSGVYFANNLVFVQGTSICGNVGTQTFGAFVNLGGNRAGTACTACSADLNGDNTVNGADLGLLLGEWGSCSD